MYVHIVIFTMLGAHISKQANIFRILSDPTRMRLLRVLFNAQKELCVGDIAHAIGASHSATSHQLRKLEFLGVVQKCRKGQEMCYCLNRKQRITKRMTRLLKAI